MEESLGYIVTVKSKAEKKVFTTRCHLSKKRRHMLIFKRMNLMVCKQFLNTTHKNTQKHFLIKKFYTEILYTEEFYFTLFSQKNFKIEERSLNSLNVYQQKKE